MKTKGGEGVKVYMIDLNSGRLLSPVVVGDDMPAKEAAALSPSYIATPPPEGMIAPRWDGEGWVEEWRGEEWTEEPTTPAQEIESPDERMLTIEAALIELAGIVAGGGV